MSTNEKIYSFTLRNDKKNPSSNTGFVLHHSSPFYNPYYISTNTGAKTKECEISNILFYDKDGVKAETSKGWFGSNNNIDLLVFVTKKALITKRKIDFNIEAPFLIKDEHYYETRYFLYIPISDLPEFEIYYEKENSLIYKCIKIGLPNPTNNYIRQVVKCLNNSRDIKIELNNYLNFIKNHTIYQKSDEEFNDCINHLIELREKMKQAIDYEQNYTVESYLKEINEINQ